MNKWHPVAFGIGVLVGVAFAAKIRSLPLASKIPAVG